MVKNMFDFTDRTSRLDGRKKNHYPETLLGDFDLVMDARFDNSMGDYNDLWEKFIIGLEIPDVREMFQMFLEQWAKEEIANSED